MFVKGALLLVRWVLAGRFRHWDCHHQLKVRVSRRVIQEDRAFEAIMQTVAEQKDLQVLARRALNKW
jgi:UDP-3-O-acyl-N-acetylglucosamine deacetylase